MDWIILAPVLIGIFLIYKGVKAVQTGSITSMVGWHYRMMKGPWAKFVGVVVTILGVILVTLPLWGIIKAFVN